MHELFYWILNMSIIASVIGIILCFLRFIKGFPKFGRYLLWGIVLIRFVCPYGISSKYSLINLLNFFLSKSFIKTVTVIEEKNGGLLPEVTLSNSIQAAAEYKPFTYRTNLLEEFFHAASVVWIIAAVSAIIAVTIIYILAKSELKKAVHRRDNIYEGGMVNTPTVYGIWKPKIVLPANMNSEDLDYILLHEAIHIKRHDNIWRMLAIITACIHWFNPLIWLFLKKFFEDSELACDEKAIKKMNARDRKNYALALLHYSNSNKTVFTSAFGSSKVKIRINNVLSYRKLTFFSTVCFVGMLAVMALILLTNAKV